MATIRVLSRNKFNSYGLTVRRDVLGCEHKFEFEDRLVRVRLPTEADADEDRRYGPASCYEYTIADGEEIPMNFDVYRVELLTEHPKPIELSETLAYAGYVSIDLATENEKRVLDTLVYEYEEFALRAFDHWIRVMRWKNDFWRIGQPEVTGYETGWATYLLEKETEKRFWSSVHTFTVGRSKPVTSELWEHVQTALHAGSTPLVWIEFPFDARYKKRNGDKVGCILSLAIACESIFRHILYKQIPNEGTIDQELFATLSEINVRAVMRHITSFSFWKEGEWRKSIHWPTINMLLDHRNNAMHIGHTRHIEDNELDEMVKVAKRFIRFADLALSPRP